MLAGILVQTTVNGAVLSVNYALLALGLTLFLSVMNILFFPHGSMYMIAAFSMYYFSVVFGINYFLAAIIAIAGLAILAVLLEKGLYRPIRGDVNRVFFLGVGLEWFLESTGYLVFGLMPKGMPAVFKGSINIFGSILTWQRLAVVLISLTAIGLLQLFITRTRLGLGMRCYVEDADAAALQGIKGNSISTLTFILGVSLAALAGVLLAPVFDITASMGTPAIFKGFLVIGLGGLGSIPGALLGALILGFLDSFGGTFVGPELTGGLVFLFIVLFLMIRPRGLVGVNR